MILEEFHQGKYLGDFDSFLPSEKLSKKQQNKETYFNVKSSQFLMYLRLTSEAWVPLYECDFEEAWQICNKFKSNNIARECNVGNLK